MIEEEFVELKSGKLQLRIAPRAGGVITRFDYVDGHKWPVMRGHDGLPESPVDAASFPLVPFVNRVRGGVFTFRGREVRLPLNLAGDASPLHGQGWLAVWQVMSESLEGCELAFRHHAGDWPWDYEARQIFELDESGLLLCITCRNLSADPMPCGLGHHPFFPCTPETRIDTDATDVWTIDEDVLPIEKRPATGEYDLRDRPACAQGLDHGFGGWSGEARIWTPGEPFEIRLSSPARFFQLYSPSSGGVLVAEPVSHANAAMNAPEEAWAELGFRVLDPGEEMTLDMRVDVRQI